MPPFSEHLFALEDLKQVNHLFQGRTLKGRKEPRVALVGRSNVGKSTLMNRILNKPCAFSSKSPGTTAKIHFYFWKEAKKILVDLPGYGYARISQARRNHWEKLMQAYFEADRGLEQVVLVWDARHCPTPQDRLAIDYVSHQLLPFQIVLSKVDLLKTQSQKHRRLYELGHVLKQMGFQNTKIHWMSKLSQQGLAQLKASLQTPLMTPAKQD